MRDEKHSAHVAAVMKNNAKYILRNQQIAFDFLLENPCVDCGEKDPVVLDFDHVRGMKDRAIGLLIRRGSSVKRLMDEIAKCEIRCANCHRRKTAKDFSWFRTFANEK